MKTPLYKKITDQIVEQIRIGLYKPGDKLPSVRRFATQQEVSISTVMAAYTELENMDLVEVRPKSGYYIKRAIQQAPPSPAISQLTSTPKACRTSERVMEIMKDSSDPAFVSFGAAIPSADFPIIPQLKRIFAQMVRSAPFLGVGYDSPKGNEPLRRQLARRAVDAGVLVSPDEIVITDGCQGAIALCLRALTTHGDIVAVETPCYYGLLQMIEALGLRAIEIPSDADNGMSINALKLALEQWPIKIVLCIPCFSNPVGALMPDTQKKALLDLIYQYDIPLIEDDIYGDLGYEGHRPKAIKSYDHKGQVLLCSSVSKTLEPQLGIGWVFPGRYLERIAYEKFLNSITSFRLPQLAVAEMMAHGNYERHMRIAREAYRQRRDRLIDLVADYFPEGTRISKPKGGFVAWIQMPDTVLASQLYIDARQQRILIAPGEIFTSSSGKYTHSIRMSYASAWTTERENAFKTVAQLARNQSGQKD
jgi:DNA-binding transcriptional MocR family regulator